ncbi:MAG: GntR family transcriptional regulator [Proteobacteria bacterium]|nr:GntR family transcriptional regulator [Pseudomonadota bacterium]
MQSQHLGNDIKSKLYREIKTAIITGQKTSGQRLEVDEIKQEYGASTTLVRDALQLLSFEHLVTIKPRSGYFVSCVSLKELRDLLELREVLEVAAVQMAVDKITDQELKFLDSIHGEYTGDDDESYGRYTDENRNFHYLIAKASGNDQLADSLGKLLDRLARFMVIRRAGDSLLDIHGILLEKLKKRDKEGAVAAIKTELRETREAVMDYIMREEGEFMMLGGGKRDEKSVDA